jgi:hypothetical protein
MAGLYPLSRMQQFDGNGRPLSGARLFLFDGGTSTPRIGYRDSSLTSPHPNPILADSAGRLPLVYLDDGFYRHRLTTRSGTLVFDDDGLPVLSTTSGGSGTSVDPDSVFKTRDIKIRFDDQPLAGYVRLNGRTIGSATSGATERANADTQSLYEELWPFANINVTGGKGASAAADFAANKPLVLPNAAGRGLFGMDNMGAGAQGVLTDAVLGSNPQLPGATGGAQTVSIAQANIPSYTLTGGSGSVTASGTTGGESQSHTHSLNATSGGESSHAHNYTDASDKNAIAIVSASGGVVQSGYWRGTTTNATSGGSNHTHGVSGSTGSESQTHNHPVTVAGTASAISIASGGAGAALNKLNPIMTFMIYVRL